MKLSNALLCFDCEEVYGLSAGHCPSCTSKSSVLISRFLLPITSLEGGVKCD
jgi:hypothetical protein